MESSKPVLGYAVATLAVAAASLLTALAQPWLGPSVSVFFFPAVLFSSLFGGYGPGLTATFLSVASLAFFFIPPAHSMMIGVDDGLRLIVFVVVALATSALSVSKRSAEESDRRSRLAIADRDRELARREERERVSRDLHDGILQGLTGVRLELQHLADAGGAGPALASRLLAVERALALEQRELRRLVDDLRVPSSDATPRGAFVDDMQQRLVRVSSEWQTPVDFHFDASASVPASLEPQLAFMCQEAVVNALKHGSPSRISVTLAVSPKVVSLTIVDDGRGFSTTRGGPKSLQARASSLGGKVSVASSTGSTRVEIVVPR